MLLKYLQGTYLVNIPIQECSALVQKALDEVGMKNLTVRKEVAPRYLLVQYSPSWVGKNFEIEFFFKERDNGTEINVKWPYAEAVPSPKDEKYSGMYVQLEEKRKQKMKKLIEDFKSKIGAKEISTT
jgi:hypothetical protein